MIGDDRLICVTRAHKYDSDLTPATTRTERTATLSVEDFAHIEFASPALPQGFMMTGRCCNPELGRLLIRSDGQTYRLCILTGPARSFVAFRLPQVIVPTVLCF